MEAVIICDDFAFAAIAATTLMRVGRQAEVNVQWATKSWPISTLKDLALAEDALVRALDSHLIVFPAYRSSVLPPVVFDWLRRWAARRTFQNAALGIIQDANTTGSTDSTFPELSRFAREHGLGLIVDESPPVKNIAKVFIRSRPKREVALPCPRSI